LQYPVSSSGIFLDVPGHLTSAGVAVATCQPAPQVVYLANWLHELLWNSATSVTHSVAALTSFKHPIDGKRHSFLFSLTQTDEAASSVI
jgi:hypothetical protein